MHIPRLNDRVHYVSYGTPGGEYHSTCRAAVITGVPRPDHSTPHELSMVTETIEVDLFVMNPTGVFLNRCARDEGHVETLGAPRAYRGGTWHTADNCPN